MYIFKYVIVIAKLRIPSFLLRQLYMYTFMCVIVVGMLTEQPHIMEYLMSFQYIEELEETPRRQ